MTVDIPPNTQHCVYPSTSELSVPKHSYNARFSDESPQISSRPLLVQSHSTVPWSSFGDDHLKRSISLSFSNLSDFDFPPSPASSLPIFKWVFVSPGGPRG